MTRTIALIVTALAFAPGCTHALYEHDDLTAPEALASHPDSTGWPLVFGEGLSGAINPNNAWHIEEDGVLTTDEKVDIFTTRSFDDFILDLEFMTGDGANSGVVVYCNDVTNWIPHSVEIQVHDSYERREEPGRSIHECGAIYGHVAPSIQTVKAPGEWNRLTIRCAGPYIDVVMNDAHIATMDMREWTSATLNPDGSEIPEWLSRAKASIEPRGHIGLQGLHGDVPVKYRNLRILELE